MSIVKEYIQSWGTKRKADSRTQEEEATMDQESTQIRKIMATKVPIEKDILEIKGEEEKRPRTRRM